MDKMPILLLTMVAVLGVYVLPSVTARFAGSHTMEVNKTAVAGSGVFNLKCAQCHTYIADELNATATADNVITAHQNAAANSSFVGPSGQINLSQTLSSTDTSRACKMCHLMSQNAVNAAGSHTRITIRPCTVCHGNSTDNGLATTVYPDANIGKKLANSTDVHRVFFLPLESETSDLASADYSGNYTKGFYACLACHTHVGINFRFVRPNSIDVGLSYTSVGWNLTNATLNMSATNTTIRSRPPGTVWQ